MLPPIFSRIGRWIFSRGRFFFPRSIARIRQTLVREVGRRWLGPAGERVAARYLQRQGYRILARSHRQRLGEIDLIALDGQCIVFVEVKTWTTGSDGDPSLAVDRRKQEKLSRAALVYLKARGLLEHHARFDVVSIVWPPAPRAQPSIRHFKSAFEAIGRGQMFR